MFTSAEWTTTSLKRSIVLLSLSLLVVVLPASGQTQMISEPIVNGVPTSNFPSVGMMGSSITGQAACTVTVIGCRTILTAAHCFCGAGTAANCPPVSENNLVFFQHGGIHAIESYSVHPGYQFGVQHDLAIAKLSSPVNGLSPSRINTIGRLQHGSEGAIVGFGRSGGATSHGLKQAGLVQTSACKAAPDATHICWDFLTPLGSPGANSSTCQGDSGGPLFVQSSDGVVVAGVTSGGPNHSCLTPNYPYDADVFLGRSWITSAAGPDILSGTCGPLPQVGSPETGVQFATGVLSPAESQHGYTLQVPTNTQLLRVTLNGEFEASILDPATDVDLTLISPAGGSCSSQGSKPVEVCEVSNPEVGTWQVFADLFHGNGGGYQITATTFAAPASTGPCVPGPSTICIDGAPGDKRFRIEVDFATSQGGGSSGKAGAIGLSSLGVSAGGLFTFFNPRNPEMLIKVLNGCPVNGNFWVFYAATTNVGFEVVVTDTQTSRVWQRINPDQTPALPVQDTSAFPCS